MSSPATVPSKLAPNRSDRLTGMTESNHTRINRLLWNRDVDDLAWSRRWPSECIWRTRKA